MSFSGLKSNIVKKDDKTNSIYFADYFPTEHVSVTNTKGDTLPKRYQDILCLNSQYQEIDCSLPKSK